MQVPPEIAFRNVEPTRLLKDAVAAGIESLEEVYERIISCRVMVEETNPGRRSGRLNHVRVDITVPGGEVVVNRNPPKDPEGQDLFLAVDQAFDVARRRLREYARKQRGDVKVRELPPHGRVVKLVDDESPRYGFLIAGDGREIYFHENSVRNDGYDDLDVGDEVRFHEQAGNDGPQASVVEPLRFDAVPVEENIPLS
jgi:cold shock CspA family protein/ribosome-associated translation inhibitor RaiA